MRTLIADAFKIDNYSLNFNQVQLSDDKTLSAAACLSYYTWKKDLVLCVFHIIYSGFN